MADIDSEALEDVFTVLLPPERIICLGLGSLVDGSPGGKRISEVQLALLVRLKNVVEVCRMEDILI